MPDSPALSLDTLPPGLPKLTVGWDAIRWGSRYIRQPNGPRARKPWVPTDRQARYLAWHYAVDEDGRWLYPGGSVRRLAKGSGKSPIAAAMSLIELAGPCRVDDIVGDRVYAKPVDMPLVEIAATSEAQTANTMRNVRAMAAKGSDLVKAHNLDPGKTVYYRPGGGELHVITSSESTAEGAESTFVVCDEKEHWTRSNGGFGLAEVIERNLAKSGNRAMSTCNAWQPGDDSVAESDWEAFVALSEGRSRGAAVLYDAIIAPPDVELGDEDSLMSALAFVYGDCPWVDIEHIRDTIWSPKSRPDVSRRFYLNQPTASVDSWVTPQEWAACVDATVAVADDDEIVLFFDGSLSDDATALIGCRIDDGHVFTVGVWEPDPSDKDSRVPVAAVDAAVEQAFARWTVRAFFADVREWEGFVKATWPERYADKLELWADPGSKDPQAIAWDMRGKTWDFTRACELAEAEIRERAFTHDGDGVVARHVGNARRRPNRWGVSIGKESRGSTSKIDAAVCVVGARMVRRLYLAAAGKRKTKQPARIWGA